MECCHLTTHCSILWLVYLSRELLDVHGVSSSQPHLTLRYEHKLQMGRHYQNLR